ncbi:MAG: NYN domain-containing protein [Candidatus Omnitrophota bacterium]
MRALVVDGYNAIFRMPGLKATMDRTLKGARDGIVALAREYQRKKGGIDVVRVVFDGQDRYRRRAHGSCAERIFSKTGEGDTEVINVVRKLSPKYRVTVVSDDNYIRNNARAHNAGVVTVSEFADSLRPRKNKTPRAKQGEKILPGNIREINRELEKRWLA